MTATIYSPPQMPARISIALVLIMSLLFGAQARPVTVKVPGCETVKCERSCCTSMACCAPQEKDAPQPAPMLAPERGGLDLAAIGLFTTSFLHVLPRVGAKVAAAQDAVAPHALPRLAVSCIRLI